MSDTVGAHNDLHSEQGALPGEHPGRSRNPVIKVADIAWLEFEKPDLVRAEAFARAFGFTTVSAHRRRAAAARHRRRRAVRDSAPRCAVAVRRYRRSRRADEVDVLRLAEVDRAHGRGRCPNPSAAWPWISSTRAAFPVHVVAGTHDLPDVASPAVHTLQFRPRATAGQRDAAAARACRPRCSGSGTSCCRPPSTSRHSNWYLDNLGMIVSDFLFFPGQRERGPTMSFIRCDRGATPTDHHTLAIALGPSQPLRAFGLSGVRSRRAGRRRRIPRPSAATSGHGASAATSRAARSSTTGAIPTASWSSTSPTATCSTPPWSRAGRRSPPRGSPSGDLPPPRTSWAPVPKPLPHEARSMITALRGDNEFDLNRLVGLLKVANS